MSLYITSLNSGSNGNCYYIGNDREAVLVDAGISCREIEKRMARLGLNMQKIKAVFVSHEHSDHIKGLPTLAKKHQIPVYITPATLHYSRCVLHKDQVISFMMGEPVTIGNLSITGFSKMHDASDPCSFIVAYNGIKVGIFTDIGIACKEVINYFSECNAAFLESNYDEAMLAAGSYPYHLKKRISGGRGHLSNRQALELFKTHKSTHMSHLLLSHLSKNNNCPNLVQKLFNEHAGGVKMVVASRYEETPVYCINAVNRFDPGTNVSISASQLSFSFA